MPPRTEWSLANRLRRRGLLATALITLLLSATVAVHYGGDMPELRHRSLHVLAERFATDAAEASRQGDWDVINKRHPIFSRHLFVNVIKQSHGGGAKSSLGLPAVPG